jgi:Ca2+-binding EF-hand superfamily protein
MHETTANLLIEDYFEISLIVLLNRVLEEWEHFQAQLRKKLLKKFIDFDANSDGVLTLDEFRELMKSLEGGSI